MATTNFRYDNHPTIRHASRVFGGAKPYRVVMRKLVSKLSEYTVEVVEYSTDIERVKLVGNTWRHVSFDQIRYFEAERDAWCDYLSRCRRV